MKNKLLFLLFLTTSGTAFSQVILDDNFNSYTVGNLGTQGGWNRDGGSAGEAKIAEINAASYGKSLQLARTTTADMWIYKDVSAGWTTRTSGNNILEVKVNFYSGSGSGLGQTQVQLTADGSSDYNIGTILYSNNSKELTFFNKNSTTLNPLVTLADNTWYNISLYYNYINGETKISVNGTVYGPYASTANKNLTELSLYTGVGTLTSGIDNISINAVNSAVLGTDEIITKSSLKVYPNPISDIVNITSDKKISAVSINDLSGKKLIETKETKLNIKSFSKGIYLLTVKYEDGIIENKKIIKN